MARFRANVATPARALAARLRNGYGTSNRNRNNNGGGIRNATAAAMRGSFVLEGVVDRRVVAGRTHFLVEWTDGSSTRLRRAWVPSSWLRTRVPLAVYRQILGGR